MSLSQPFALPKLVRAVKAMPDTPALKLAEQHGVGYDTIRDIRAHNYDGLKNVRLTHGANGRERTQVVLYDAKGYVPSGKSISGAIEMSTDGQLIRCHECGDWFENLSRHIHEHSLTAREYKLKHRLKLHSSLVNEPTRLRLIRSAITGINGGKVKQKPVQQWKSTKDSRLQAKLAMQKLRADRKAGKKTFKRMGAMNAKRTCPVQVLHDLRAVIEQTGKYAGDAVCRKNGISRSTLEAVYGTLQEANRIARGMEFAPPASSGRPTVYTEMELVGLLREFGKAHRRRPAPSDCKRGFLPPYQTYRRRFCGGWQEALDRAGFNADPRFLKRPR